jgi:hypothetical protein
VGQFCFAVGLMYILGYPLGNTALLGTVSKGCEDKPQGNVMVSEFAGRPTRRERNDLLSLSDSLSPSLSSSLFLRPNLPPVPAVPNTQ